MSLVQDSVVRASLGYAVPHDPETLPQAAAGSLFQVEGGRVLVTSLVGEVTVAVGAGANNTKLVFSPTTGADQDLCAVVDIDAAAVGSQLTVTGTPTDAMVSSTYIANPVLANPLMLMTGTVDLDCSGSATGEITWHVHFLPLDSGAAIRAI